MRIGVPKEIKNHEYRVGLVPGSVRELVAAGHQVMVETQAGMGIGFQDADYVRAGATVAADADAVFAAAEMIVKVKEPQPVECRKLRAGQILFTYLHLAPDPDQARLLQESGCTAIAYETVTDRNGRLPLLAPMSEIAGRDGHSGRRRGVAERARADQACCWAACRACCRGVWWCWAAALSAPMPRVWRWGWART